MKETKAQRLEREAAQVKAYQEKMIAAYPQRLMELLERAGKFNFRLTVKDGQFELWDRDNLQDTIKLTPEYTPASLTNLDELEYEINLLEEQQREAQRKKELRIAALAKLTDEEARALGLEKLTKFA